MKKYIPHPKNEVRRKLILNSADNEFQTLYFFLGLWRGYILHQRNITFESYMSDKNAIENFGTQKAWYFIKKGQKYIRDEINRKRIPGSNTNEFIPISLAEVRKLGHKGKMRPPVFPIRGDEIKNQLVKTCFDQPTVELVYAWETFISLLYVKWCKKYPDLSFLSSGGGDSAIMNTRDYFIGYQIYITDYMFRRECYDFLDYNFFNRVNVDLDSQSKK